MTDKYTDHQRAFLVIAKALADNVNENIETVIKAVYEQLLQEFVVPEQRPAPVEKATKIFPRMIIGITGDTGSGKDTLAKYLRSAIELEYPDTPGVNIHPLAFALKEEVLELVYTWIDDSELNQNSDEYDRQSVRYLLDNDWKSDIGRPLYQGLGELARKTGGNNYWVDRLLMYIDSVHTTVIVPDVRYYDTEAKFILNHERGVLITTLSGNRRGDSHLFPTHKSETDIPRCRTAAPIGLPSRITEAELEDYCVTVLLPRIMDAYEAKQNRETIPD